MVKDFLTTKREKSFFHSKQIYFLADALRRSFINNHNDITTTYSMNLKKLPPL